MSTLTQVLVQTSSQPRVDFYADLDANPTYVVARPDGTTLASGTATKVTGATGVYQISLAAQPNVTLLTVTWTGNLGGQPQTATTQVEVLGALLFTLPEFRALKVAGSTPFSSSVTYSDAAIMQARAETLDEFEEILGFSPVPRFYRQTLSVGYDGVVLLREQMPTRLLSVTVNGVTSATSGYYLDGVRMVPVSGYSVNPWYAYGTGNLIVEYVAGWDRPKGDGSNIAMLRAAMKLNPSMPSTATTVSYPDGSSYTYDPAGQVFQRGNTIRVRHFGVPAIDSWLHRHAMDGLAVA